ncbi:glycosyltransferase A (GT-A) superfamily protein (DUF2064 family) [Nocardiopsis mwathae]|uniref:Glycosyltransferase A (GT-A) superfamily protein (DUF2064 family) n=1 Tax=Nocardiopsis mwathae TaxID=1472723 RepID=A0A7W9YJE2_9ACTN|nr:DUF2064 domain-containing protein [Nocardiopsis mwathae]MBB6173247.1 glycosyltransferase A (GT-A) superfamily protein (DUF2064 family) [Nocardiopsis mwathae]
MAAVLITPETGAAPPPGIAPATFRAALTEDTHDVVADLERCTPAVAAWAGNQEEADRLAAAAADLTWPGTPVLALSGGTPLARALTALAEYGARQAAVIPADTPDLPKLLVGKLFRALGGADAAICPAAGGGLAALAARLPTPDWLHGADLDAPDAAAHLTGARPHRRDLSVTPGWHRIRTPADLARLDPGLEGWEATRSLLTCGRPR